MKESFLVAFGTDDGKTLRDKGHFGDSQKFGIYKIGKDSVSFVGWRENAKVEEDETQIHGDPRKANAVKAVLKEVDAVASVEFGPNIKRLLPVKACMIMDPGTLEHAARVVQSNLDRLVLEIEKGEQRKVLDLRDLSKEGSGPLRIAIASGKGGTGKTTVATCLAQVAEGLGHSVTYLDCDVEEPNGHLFLKPEITEGMPVGLPVPKVDQDTCICCGECAEICQYSAIVCVKDKILTFPDLCHSCGGCVRVCPVDAIEEVPRTVGTLEQGKAGGIDFIHGRLNIGEVMAPPLIKAVRERAKNNGNVNMQIIDAPPGTSCPVITAIGDADLVVLVTEPTPFGLNDLDLAIDMVRELGLKHVVVVNRHEDDNNSAREFCNQKGVEIIAEIPDDRRIAEAYSRGETMVSSLEEYKGILEDMYETIRHKAQRDKVKKQV